MSQASSASDSSIYAPGGSITKNSPGIWIAVVIGAVIVAVIWLKNRKN